MGFKSSGKKIKNYILTAAGIIIVAGGSLVTQKAQIPEVYNQPQVIETVDNYEEKHFKNNELLSEHYEKHGKEMGFDSEEAYEHAASIVINNPDSLHKLEAEDGDDVYYLEATNEFVIVSKRGYIRTYFKPDQGIKYYNKQ